ncbi:hypothetical protein EQV77_12480 [Halobacillus fulvus]|nr:hypothetical protein EQV77_12480 [Halobacillus fulvus]
MEPIIVLENFTCEKQSDKINGPEYIRVKRKDRLYLSGEPHYVETIGFYVPLETEFQERFYILAEDLEELYKTRILQTEADVHASIEHHKQEVDTALDQRNAEEFQYHSSALKELMELTEERFIKQ